MTISRGHFTLRGALCLAATATLLTALLVSVVPSARAVENVPDTSIGYPNQYFAYANAGESLDVVFEKNAMANATNPGDLTVTLDGPGFAGLACHIATADPVGTICDFTALNGGTPPSSAESGIWRVAFTPITGTEQAHYPGILFAHGRFTWDISVNGLGGELPGRVWSDQFTMAQPLPLQPGGTLLDLTYYFQSKFGVLYQVDYSEYNGIHSIFLADPVGIRENGTCTSAYVSIYFNDPNLSPADGECDDGAFKLFFEPPDAALPATATTWSGGTDWINPPVLVPDAFNLGFVANSPDIQSGTFGFEVVNFPAGNVTVQVDTNNDGNFTGPEDRTIITGASDAAPVSVPFNGLDGFGVGIPANQAIAFRVLIDEIAEIHFVNYDVETRGGIEVTQVTNHPALLTPAGDKTISWNDTHLDPNSDVAIAPQPVTNPITWAITTWPGCPAGDVKCAGVTFQGDEVNSAGGVHGWQWSPEGPGLGLAIGWGNNRYIDDWKAASIEPVITPELEVDGRDGTFTVAKTSDPPSGSAVEAGDTVLYGLTVTNSSDVTAFDVELTDDLSGVFDDAVLTSGPAASSGIASIVGDTLTWQGNVSPGTPVEILYQVTVNAEDALGDLLLGNVVTTLSEGAQNCPPVNPGPECSTEHPVTLVGGGVTPGPDDDDDDEAVVAGATETAGAGGSLPFTGGTLGLMVLAALMMLGAGGTLYESTRLRRRKVRVR